ncbi:hypothetical protein MPTK1_4g05170 [Marchantia polymorpha subsp. ruderalis]|uniref:Uncharacterized protein n=2 Tax=Marchantia polymorpha TaxID=3197 RepID=A0AAF6B6J6_MARPO|nr:hypothetical protein MARPO_0087s0072 [Marchantia polymorpha]BBN07630.1 hypothetical protein Mp_4g05170 [Marchantia polymorpha subsp. ruderalis]|eukprot:PTQ33642.1 hypothetical protein MARPO_0087s0072 [Marchantia polymorpha]
MRTPRGSCNGEGSMKASNFSSKFRRNRRFDQTELNVSWFRPLGESKSQRCTDSCDQSPSAREPEANVHPLKRISERQNETCSKSPHQS